MEPMGIANLAERIAGAERFVVFTGAGISTESGIPDYRSQGGLWTRVNPVYFDDFLASEQARITYWQQKSEFYRDLLTRKPNPAHAAVAELFRLGRISRVITQNIDGLHQEAGLPDNALIELHGNTRRVRCLACGKTMTFEAAEALIAAGSEAPRCDCGGLLKPDVISFGQAMPENETREAMETAAGSDLFMVVGSTLTVQPAALMPAYAKRAGAFLVIVNLSSTPMDPESDLVIQEPAGEILPRIAAGVRERLKR